MIQTTNQYKSGHIFKNPKCHLFHLFILAGSERIFLPSWIMTIPNALDNSIK